MVKKQNIYVNVILLLIFFLRILRTCVLCVMSVTPMKSSNTCIGLLGFRDTDRLSRELTLSNLFCTLLKKGCSLKGKNLLPLVDPFSEGH